MTPLFIYYLKATVALSLFYAFYRLLFDRDTFFEWKRVVLMCSIALSAIYPFIDISALMTINEPVRETIVYYSTVLPEFTFRIEERSWWEIYDLSSAVWMIYLTVVLALSIRLSVNLISIFRLVYKGETTQIMGIKVILLKGNTAPFSFFRWIFVNPETHTEADLDEILAHEKTHVREWHSLDVIVCELTCIAFWFNPFVWLTKKAIRQNLEFLADKRVIVSGYDCRDYQYHLLRLTHQSAAAKLVNNFNVSELKKRIIMMNRKRSSSLVLTKYALLIPLVSVLLLTNQAEVLAKKVEKLEPVKNFTKVIDKKTSQLTEKVDEIVEQPKVSDEANKETPPSTEVFMSVEQMPQYPGGERALMNYISKNLRYPVKAIESNISGTVIVRFVVNKEGAVENPTILKGVDPSLDNEAIRVVSGMDKWTPGKQKGENVAVYYTLPIKFAFGDEKGNPDFKGVQVTTYGKKKENDVLNFNVPKGEKAPIFIVDGKECTQDEMKSINPDKIKEISVLKDQAATKLYGDKGKNGVVLITMKTADDEAPANFAGKTIFVDGKLTSLEDFKRLDQKKFAYFGTVDEYNDHGKIYGSKGSKSVVIFTTRKPLPKSGRMSIKQTVGKENIIEIDGKEVTEATKPFIVVDGKEISYEEFKKLNPSKIQINSREMHTNGYVNSVKDKFGSKVNGNTVFVQTR